MNTPTLIALLSYLLVWAGIAVLIFWGLSKISDRRNRLFAYIAAGLILASLIVAGINVALFQAEGRNILNCPMMRWRY